MIACLLLAAVEVTVDVTVDRRVELMSIIFRLAGSPEYNHLSSRSPYSRDVESHFPEKHPAIESESLHPRQGLGPGGLEHANREAGQPDSGDGTERGQSEALDQQLTYNRPHGRAER